jgi:hypothetical protein
MARTPEEMEASMIRSLEDKTGKGLDQWLEVTAASGLDKHGQIVKLLKSEHGMTHGYANLVAHKMLQAGARAPRATDLVDAQYAGAKQELRPIYEAIVTRVAGFGDDVEIAPKKTYVSLRRKKQFGLIQPSTRTRVDVGINLAGVEPTNRLEASGSFNAMVSHRVRLAEPGQVDDQLIDWLRQAYEVA